MPRTALVVKNYHQNANSAAVEKSRVRGPIAILFPCKGPPAASGHRVEPDWTFAGEGRTKRGEKLRPGDVTGVLDPGGPQASTAPGLPILWPNQWFRVYACWMTPQSSTVKEIGHTSFPLFYRWAAPREPAWLAQGHTASPWRAPAGVGSATSHRTNCFYIKTNTDTRSRMPNSH